MALMSVQW